MSMGHLPSLARPSSLTPAHANGPVTLCEYPHRENTCYHPKAEVTGMHIHVLLLMWGLGIHTQVPILLSKLLLPWKPSPQPPHFSHSFIY